MQRTEMMQELWKKAEATKNEREKKLLELAGNLVEATFTTTPIIDAIDFALQDSLNKGEPSLHEDLVDSEEIDQVAWLEKRRDTAMELAELGVKSALLLHSRLDRELQFFLDKSRGE